MSANVVAGATPRTRTACSLLQADDVYFAKQRLSSIKDKLGANGSGRREGEALLLAKSRQRKEAREGSREPSKLGMSCRNPDILYPTPATINPSSLANL